MKPKETNAASGVICNAFTLAELLMAVLVISIIMVALAPVITKRAYDNVSVEIAGKKGLEIYTNAGVYAFDVPLGINTLFISGAGGGGGGAGATFVDKSVTFNNSTTWSVPQGVNQLTFTITGAGGGGGAGNGSSLSEKCLSGEVEILRGAQDESNLCMMAKNRNVLSTSGQTGGFWNSGIIISSPYETVCTGGNCAWAMDRMLFSYKGAKNVCRSYMSNTLNIEGGYRLPAKAEFDKLVKAKYIDTYGRSGMLNLCSRETCKDFPNGNCSLENSTEVPVCSGKSSCLGVTNDWCAPFILIGSDGYFSWQGKDAALQSKSGEYYSAASVRCVKSVKKYQNYSGAGGSSGAELTKTINVLPSDTITISIGAGGAGGKYAVPINNGINTKTGNGSRGETAQIVHKRAGVTIGTYYVKGGFGGYGASNSANASAIINGTSANQTTPLGTCYANSATACTSLSYSGEAGGENIGGNGGKVKNSGTIIKGEASSGGYMYIDEARTASQKNTEAEADSAKGQTASIEGFGGGGGLTPTWAYSTSNFYEGGKGASAKVDITYRVVLPGGGGGAAGTAGMNSSNTDTELVYKVKQGSRIVFTVGQGGDGGSQQQNGYDGYNTVVGDNDIIFYGGKGGLVSTDAQKNSLLGGLGGAGTGVKYNNTIINIGESGAQGQLKINNVLQNYGFDGGVGGKTYLGFEGGCAGGIYSVNKLTYNCQTSSSANGLEAKIHDPVNNRHGGAGGGGGGTNNSYELGSGGSGSCGYLRIRWSESENKDW